MEKKAQRFAKIYPWYSGFTGDLLFYIAIDTLFLSLIKNFSPAQIVSITSLAQFACIILQFPVLLLMRRMGNTNSARVGGLCLLLSSVLITFGQSYFVVLLGRIFHDVATVFRTASCVALENNLDLMNRRHDFVRIRTNANTVYAVITMLISFVASFMFNLNPYFPMIGCITSCAIGFVLSWFMVDCSPYDHIVITSQKSERPKAHYDRLIWLAIVVFSIFYPIVATGQSEGKLFIQQHLLLDFSTESTSLILGAMICVSRIIRVFSNVLFAKLYEKQREKTGVLLTVLLCISIGCLFLGSFIPLTILKITVMAMGYVIILFVRDPFRLYMQDVVLENSPKEQHQTLLTMLEFGIKVGTVGMGLSFSAILLKYPMLLVMGILFAIALIEVVLSMQLYHIIVHKKAKAE